MEAASRCPSTSGTQRWKLGSKPSGRVPAPRDAAAARASRRGLSRMERLRLERRPEARAFSVETLLQQVRDGKIRIPDFQRPLRWRAQRTRVLLSRWLWRSAFSPLAYHSYALGTSSL